VGSLKTKGIVMKTTLKTLNTAGLTEIREFLLKNHKEGETFNAENIKAWGEEANFQLREGNDPDIEIPYYDSISGHTMTYTVSPLGICSEEFEIDE
jgi:hypothetical protein